MRRSTLQLLLVPAAMIVAGALAAAGSGSRLLKNDNR